MKGLITAAAFVVGGFAFALGTAGQADAIKSKFSRSVICEILQPCEIPPKYASGPFLAKPVIRKLPLRALQSRCGGSRHIAGASEFPYRYLGCSQFRGNRCIVHVPSNVHAVSALLYDMIVEHELAHCRGWVHRHY